MGYCSTSYTVGDEEGWQMRSGGQPGMQLINQEDQVLLLGKVWGPHLVMLRGYSLLLLKASRDSQAEGEEIWKVILEGQKKKK